MYCDYWNLNKSPFDNVPDSSMYVDCHVSMENVISETIFAIKEGNECFAVIVGEVGLGKTLSLRIIIDSLEPEKYKVALITNPALSFVQLLREIIGQITGKQCEEKNKVDLLEIFNRLLFETNDQGKKIVIVIDESNVLTKSNLDDLRLLTNMQDDERNLFTLILAGQIELAQKLEHPKMANLFQRIGTYGHIEKLPSEEALKTYVETRLKLAGSQRKIFTDDAIPIIWEFSEYGTPRLANKICKLCDRFQKLSKTTLQKSKLHSHPKIEPSKDDIEVSEPEALPKNTRTSSIKKTPSKIKIPPIEIPPPPEIITAETKADILENTKFYSDKAMEEIPAHKPAFDTPDKPKQKPILDIPAPPEVISFKTQEISKFETKVDVPSHEPPFDIPDELKQEPIFDIPAPPDTSLFEEQGIIAVNKRADLPMHEPVSDISEVPKHKPIIDMPVSPEIITVKTNSSLVNNDPLLDKTVEADDIPVETKIVAPEQTFATTVPPPIKKNIYAVKKAVPLPKPSSTYVPIQRAAINTEKMESQLQATSVSKKESNQQPPAQTEKEAFEEVLIGQFKVKLSIPSNIIRQAKMASSDSKNKLAGYWSAQIIKENPHMMHSPLVDPVSIWFDIKNFILNKFDGTSKTNSAMNSL
ncbi:MAG: AAA family ATPase [Deltaproteobacteria bacterium]|nr:AAA family ATPase [Deltaproteobacteria bacterium]